MSGRHAHLKYWLCSQKDTLPTKLQKALCWCTYKYQIEADILIFLYQLPACMYFPDATLVFKPLRICASWFLIKILPTSLSNHGILIPCSIPMNIISLSQLNSSCKSRTCLQNQEEFKTKAVIFSRKSLVSKRGGGRGAKTAVFHNLHVRGKCKNKKTQTLQSTPKS